ncbi:hypothetical protein LTR72_003314 [Exophiala xenobiotica]|nr:hypothetical protein LTR72_003314 [Exophiala xenobiotica]KAK5301072.1 hypothetical protein LTR14_001470 [Exophiala xenobiotica]KAK5320585.1 hypothetical protein LTR93_006797 [Exophiala xenobiotica]KAK5489496.1 hypothetical protein LTR55_004015 [Exophiala xenobiotica]
MDPSTLLSQQTLNAAIYSNRFERSPICSTGNCTFPNFSSVGWCSKCSQPSDWKFIEGCSLVFKDTDFYFSTTLQYADDGWLYTANRNCTLSSESGHLHTNITITALAANITTDEKAAINSTFQNYTTAYRLVQPFSEIATTFWPNPDPQPGNQPYPYVPWGERVPMGEWINMNFKTVNWSLVVDSVNTSICTLDLCLRDYEVTVASGTTRAVATNQRFGRRYYRSGKNFAEITAAEVVQEFDEGGDRWLAYVCWEPGGTPNNSSWKYESDSDMYVSPSDFAFCISSGDTFWVWYALVGTAVAGNLSLGLDFGSGATLENGKLHFNSTKMPISLLLDKYNSMVSYNGSLTVSFTEYFSNLPNDWATVSTVTTQRLGLEAVMSSIAASLTQMGLEDPSSNDILGKLGTVEAVVHVRWEWLALPGFLMVGVALFLVVTVILNNRSKTPVWKSSTNALLYHGLEEELKGDSDLLTASSMADLAASTLVSLTTSVKCARPVLAMPAAPSAIPDAYCPISKTEMSDVREEAVPGATTM